MAKLNGKIAVVTGANSGMGLAAARLFAQEGAEVVLTGRRQSELDAAVKGIGERAHGFTGDIANLADDQRLHDFVKERFGRVDVVFANAGTGALKPFGAVSEADFDKLVAVNMKGTFFSVQALLPLIPDGGSIILNASIAATKGQPAFTVYAATKAALRSFARTWTTDLSPRKIRVNSLSPGYVVTPILMSVAGLTQEQSDAFYAHEGQKTPAGRPGRAEEVASAALFLASDESSYVTGIDLPVDGGVTQV